MRRPPSVSFWRGLMRGIVVFAVASTLVACGDESDSEVISVSLRNSDTYHIEFAVGDEEGLRIVTQPKHFEVSQIRRDSSTGWNARYEYRAAAGFVGSDRAELELMTGSDGATAPTKRRRVSLRLTVRN